MEALCRAMECLVVAGVVPRVLHAPKMLHDFSAGKEEADSKDGRRREFFGSFSIQRLFLMLHRRLMERRQSISATDRVALAMSS